MPTITVVGLGPGALGDMSLDTYQLLKSGRKVFLRTEMHPCVPKLKAEGIRYESFDSVYATSGSFTDVYQAIVQRLLVAAGQQDIIYVVPGHPRTGERSVELLVNAAVSHNVKVEIKNAMSFLDPLFNCLNIDPVNGVCVIDGSITIDSANYRVWNIVSQVYDRFTASERKLDLMNYYPDEFPIYVVRAAGNNSLEKIERLPLYELDRVDWIDHLTCLAIPPLPPELYPADWDKLLMVMEQLRGEHGCPWDKEQTHQSLRTYLIEETYEVLETIDQQDMHKLCEELGDLLLQIVFHAQLARENNEFTMQDVVRGIVEKLIRRHPHVFVGATATTSQQVLENWDKIKETETGQKQSIFEGVTKGLTALMYAKKVQGKAAKVGFDWNSIDGPVQKVYEELDELLAAKTQAGKEEELGDLLFAAVNISRFIDADPEVALRQTVQKFINRFSFIEQQCKLQGKVVAEMDLAEMDALWEKSKLR